MSTRRMIGLVLLAGGLITLGIAWQNSDSFGDQFSHFFTGDYSNKTIWLTLIGAIATVIGLLGLAVPGRD